MNKKSTFDTVAGTIFLVIAIVHLFRIFYGWEVLLDGMIVPLWVSYAAVIVAGILSYFGLRKSSQTM